MTLATQVCDGLRRLLFLDIAFTSEVVFRRGAAPYDYSEVSVKALPARLHCTCMPSATGASVGQTARGTDPRAWTAMATVHAPKQ